MRTEHHISEIKLSVKKYELLYYIENPNLPLLYCDKSLQSCLTPCDSVDCSLPGSSVHGILPAKILEWVPIPSPGDLPDPGIKPRSLMSPALVGGSLPLVPPGKSKFIFRIISYLCSLTSHFKHPKRYALPSFWLTVTLLFPVCL